MATRTINEHGDVVYLPKYDEECTYEDLKQILQTNKMIRLRPYSPTEYMATIIGVTASPENKSAKMLMLSEGRQVSAIHGPVVILKKEIYSDNQ